IARQHVGSDGAEHGEHGDIVIEQQPLAKNLERILDRVCCELWSRRLSPGRLRPGRLRPGRLRRRWWWRCRRGSRSGLWMLGLVFLDGAIDQTRDIVKARVPALVTRAV